MSENSILGVLLIDYEIIIIYLFFFLLVASFADGDGACVFLSELAV